MAESIVHKSFRDGTLRLYNGAFTYTFKFEEGNLKLEIPGPEVVNNLDRGRLADEVGGVPSLRYGKDRPMKGSFSAYLTDLSSTTEITRAQFITKTGYYASTWGSSLGANAEVKTLNLEWIVAGVTHGDSFNRGLLLPYCTFEGDVEEAETSKIGFSWTSWCLYPTAI